VDDGNALTGVFACLPSQGGGSAWRRRTLFVNTTSPTPTQTVAPSGTPAGIAPAFAELGLAEPLLRALAAANYTTPTPIQAQAIPALLQGRDMLGLAQTGTGKTAAFALPILQQLAEMKDNPAPKSVRALILAPTRELAVQISDSFKTYGRNLRLRQAVILGGVSQGPQVRSLSRGVDILIATPGRLMDLLNQRHLRLDKVSHLVLDEADRMLDMGFIRDVRKIVAAIPARRHSLLFSATMPAEVAKLAAEMLHNPLRVEVTPQKITVERIEQSVYHVSMAEKRDLLEKLLRDPALSRVIVFTRTKHRANRVAEQLDKAGIPADAIHGNKSQNARQRALEDFRNGRARVLVATDIAARGIDVPGITHVINYELPNEPESYVHRIGRTARAGAGGAAISFCDADERGNLRDIERLTKQAITVIGAAPANDDRGPRRAAANQNRGQRPGQAQRKRQPEHGRDRDGGRQESRGERPAQRAGGQRPGFGSGQRRDEQTQGQQARDQQKPGDRRTAGGHAGHGGNGGKPAAAKGKPNGGQRPFKGPRRPHGGTGTGGSRRPGQGRTSATSSR
jgi:ATP-dependent RNA helicase RhlE